MRDLITIREEIKTLERAIWIEPEFETFLQLEAELRRLDSEMIDAIRKQRNDS